MKQLNNLISQIHEHPALNNEFYSNWCNQPLSIQKIRVFARNYWEFTYRFPENLALLVSKTEDVIARVEYTKILHSELGHGNYQKSHSILFEKFCNDLFSHLCKTDFLKTDQLTQHFELLPSTRNLVNGEKKLYSENIAIAAGAQLALECQAYTMLTQLYDGARNYISYWPTKSEFHESCEFFYAHIGSTEKEHRIEALEAVHRIATSEKDLANVELGFNQHLNLFYDFWNGIAKQMNKS